MTHRDKCVSFKEIATPSWHGRLSRRDLVKYGTGLGVGGALLGGLTHPMRALAAQEGAKPVELAIWLGGEPGTVNAYTDLITEYQQLHPEVKAKVTFVGSDLFNPTLLPALNAGTGPDIWMGGTGPGQPAAIISAGHTLDLTSYYCKNGWNTVIPETIVNYTSSDGKFWAVGDSVETTLMFYNKDIFAKQAVNAPTTWKDLVAVSDKMKSAGYEIPIGLGGADKWPISHWQSMLWGRFAGPDGVDNVMFGEGQWDEKPFVDATAVLSDLNKAGYFGPNALAVVYDDVVAQFWRGDVPMIFTGTWVIGDAVRKLGDKMKSFGVFQVPQPVDGKPVYPTEDIGEGWYINSGTKNADAAADLLNFLLFRNESRKKLLGSGDDVPVGTLDLTGVTLPTLLAESLTLLNEGRKNGTVHAFLDTVTPANMTDVTYDGLQALLAGKMSPEQFCAAAQEAWTAAKAEGAIMKRGGVSCS